MLLVGSAFADFMFDRIGRKLHLHLRHQNTYNTAAERLPRIYKALEFMRMETGAFSQLTRRYMQEDFNPRTPDLEGVR